LLVLFYEPLIHLFIFNKSKCSFKQNWKMVLTLVLD